MLITNNLKVVNKHFRGEQGLSMIQHQKSLLQDFLRNIRNKKLNIRCTGLFEQVVDENLILSQYNLPATRFNIHNEEELTQAIEDSVKQILTSN